MNISDGADRMGKKRFVREHGALLTVDDTRGPGTCLSSVRPPPDLCSSRTPLLHNYPTRARAGLAGQAVQRNPRDGDARARSQLPATVRPHQPRKWNPKEFTRRPEHTAAPVSEPGEPSAVRWWGSDKDSNGATTQAAGRDRQRRARRRPMNAPSRVARRVEGKKPWGYF
jgi:hypothetical protein